MESLEVVENQVLASRWDRCFASLIDAVFLMLVSIPSVYLLGFHEYPDPEGVPVLLSLSQGLISVVLYLAINWVPLKSNAQTWGKRIISIRIVGDDGEKLPINTLMFRRYAFQFGVGLMPVIGSILSLVDSVFIFRSNRKCLHDYVAKSRVVNT